LLKCDYQAPQKIPEDAKKLLTKIDESTKDRVEGTCARVRKAMLSKKYTS
jgi:hypothetical protein